MQACSGPKVAYSWLICLKNVQLVFYGTGVVLDPLVLRTADAILGALLEIRGLTTKFTGRRRTIFDFKTRALRRSGATPCYAALLK